MSHFGNPRRGSAEKPRPSPGRLVSAAAAGAAVAVLVVAAALETSAAYGWVSFVAAPFLIGLGSALTLNHPVDYAWRWSFAAMLLGHACVAVVLLVFAVEGLICLAMASPLAVGLGALGVAAGYSVLRRSVHPAQTWIVLLALTPLLLAAETRLGDSRPLRSVVTVVEIDAPPSVVWPRVIALDELPPPTETVFRLGIAYPLRARLDGEGVGATRYCEFSTGPFVEPITVWEPGRRLAFDVEAQPDSMRELSPFADLRPAHLRDGLQFRRGEFLLTALPGGRTRLQGTTWYELHLSPGAYWGLWSDALIHVIHHRVLRHIASLSESEAG